jgi:hypothetical protein
MNAQEALLATMSAREKTAQRLAALRAAEVERELKRDEHLRSVLLPEFIGSIHKEIADAVAHGLGFISHDTDEPLLAELAMAALSADGYTVHITYIPETNDDGWRRPGYTNYSVHVVWGYWDRGICQEERL